MYEDDILHETYELIRSISIIKVILLIFSVHWTSLNSKYITFSHPNSFVLSPSVICHTFHLKMPHKFVIEHHKMQKHPQSKLTNIGILNINHHPCRFWASEERQVLFKSSQLPSSCWGMLSPSALSAGAQGDLERAWWWGEGCQSSTKQS